MAKRLLTLSLANSSNYWQEAFRSLPAEERELFAPKATEPLGVLREVVLAAERARERATTKRWEIKLRGRIVPLRSIAEKLIQWANDFKALGDTVMQYDPGHAAIPWAAIRFILQLITAESQSEALVLVGLERVACAIDRCVLYEAFLARNAAKSLDLLATSLVRLYGRVLRFLATCKKQLSRHYLCATPNLTPKS
jgi:hypothetical protein